MAGMVTRRNGPRGHGHPPSVAVAMSAWIALARQRGVSDREYRLGVELWTFAGRESLHGQPRCWRDGEGWAYKVWPRIEPKDSDPAEKQANALTRRMGCKRRKVEQALSGLCKKALICRVPRPGGPPGKRERFNLQADTILLVPDTALKAASPRVSTTDSAQSGQSDARSHAEPNQLSHSTSLEQTTPPSKSPSTPKQIATATANGLVGFVEETAEPFDQNRSDSNHEAAVDERRWGEDGPELADLTQEMIAEVLAHPDYRHYRCMDLQHDRRALLSAWRKIHGYALVKTIRKLESELRAIGYWEVQVPQIAREFAREPDALRAMMHGVRSAKNPPAALATRIEDHRRGTGIRRSE